MQTFLAKVARDEAPPDVDNDAEPAGAQAAEHALEAAETPADRQPEARAALALDLSTTRSNLYRRYYQLASLFERLADTILALSTRTRPYTQEVRRAARAHASHGEGSGETSSDRSEPVLHCTIGGGRSGAHSPRADRWLRRSNRRAREA